MKTILVKINTSKVYTVNNLDELNNLVKKDFPEVELDGGLVVTYMGSNQ